MRLVEAIQLLGAHPGDEPTVEIEQVQENVAFANIVDSDPRAL